MDANNVSLPVTRLEFYLTLSSLYALLLVLTGLPTNRLPWVRLMLIGILFINTIVFSVALFRESRRIRRRAPEL